LLLIKTGQFERGGEFGQLACVVSEAEYQLEIEDHEELEYVETTDPGPYNVDITGEEDEYVIKRIKAEHKRCQIDYQRYLGCKRPPRGVHRMHGFNLAPLRKNRAGFASVTIHQFLAHLQKNVSKELSSKQRNDLRASRSKSSGTKQRIFNKISLLRWRRSKQKLRAGAQRLI
jgi:hypothetical protein